MHNMCRTIDILKKPLLAYSCNILTCLQTWPCRGNKLIVLNKYFFYEH